MNDFLAEAREAFGDVFTVRMYGSRPTVVFANPDGVRELMRGSNARLGAAMDLVQAFAGSDNLLLQNGEPHALHRRRLMPALMGDALTAHEPTMKSAIEEGIDELPRGQRVPLVPWARSVTLSVIQQCLFGMRDGEEYRALADDVIYAAEQSLQPLPVMAGFVVSPSILRPLSIGRFASDGSRAPDPFLLRGLVRHPVIAANRRVRDRLFAHVRGVREGRIEVEPSSMLAVLLRLAEKQGAELDDRSLVDDLITLLIGGHDTTAVSFAWLVLLLGRHPEVLAELRRELANEGGFASLEPERLGKLRYLDATIRESMRLHPIGAGFGRTTLEPTTVAGIDLPAGVVAFALSEGVHRDESRFPDPLRFDPAHMLDRRLGLDDWFPFGGGYRRCLGAFFATLELKFLLAAFVERVSFEAVHQDGPVGLGTKSMVIAPVDDALVRIHAIRPRETSSFSPDRQRFVGSSRTPNLRE